MARLFPRAVVRGIQLGVGLGVFNGSWGGGLSTASAPVLALPHLGDLSTVLVLPQLPLTPGNSVFGAADTARMYYEERAGRVTHRNLLLSVGLVSATAGLIGGMPLCHWSEGVTAYYRLGARTGGTNLMIRGVLLLLAVFL